MPDKSLKFYTVFHLNLAYSSIEETERQKVISSCYWPILRLVKNLNLPLGIEASGYTLEAVADLDQSWVAELRLLTEQGRCQFVGSGYSQLIGPLVPAEVNRANLELGNESYDKLLGFRPKLALVNEQAYSCGLIQNYLDAGYKAIIMEWDNPAAMHKDWSANWRYLPQYACGQHGEKMAVIWNKSLAFQQFQRYAHGDQDMEEYLLYLASHCSDTVRVFPLYGNDVEVFDYRPGRFTTEPLLESEGEWERIERLLIKLKNDDRFSFIAPGKVLELLAEPGAGNLLHLESTVQPVPVKKQEKYNLSRWASTGRDDTGINSACYRFYRALKSKEDANREDWRELCYLWSSDFRTHITERRWNEYLKRLAAFQERLGIPGTAKVPESPVKGASEKQRHGSVGPGKVAVRKIGRLLVFESDSFLLKLNMRRGLAIEELWFEDKSGYPLIGTLRHGYYDDIRFGADWYSGHLVMELLGEPKITDLEPVEPVVEETDSGLVVRGEMKTQLGMIIKKLYIDPVACEIKLGYELNWVRMPAGSFRLGFLTLHPQAFESKTLFYTTNNGGFKPEHFPLSGSSVDHGAPVSFLVSSGSGLGLTEGWVRIGDARRCLQVSVNQDLSALIGLVRYQEIDGTFFCRLAFSARELDETVKREKAISSANSYELSLKMYSSDKTLQQQYKIG